MSDEKISIEFEKEALETIFKEAGVNLPENPTADDIKNAVSSMKKKLTPSKPVVEEVKEPTAPKTESPSEELLNKGASSAQEQTPMDEIELNGKNVLVVDDLGVINYQFSCILKRDGFKVHTTTSLSEGIEYFKTKRVDVAILDLFLPSEREGIMLLEELVKIRKVVNKDCRIVMMSSDLKPELKKLCKSLGADKFIEKSTGWHQHIVEMCS